MRQSFREIRRAAAAAQRQADLKRQAAAQAKADQVIATVAEPVDSNRLLRVAVTDVETGQRLATGFVNYQDGDQ